MKRRGRPCKDGVRTEEYHIRLTKDEMNMFEMLSYKTGLSKADVFRKALKTQYEIQKYVD